MVMALREEINCSVGGWPAFACPQWPGCEVDSGMAPHAREQATFAPGRGAQAAAHRRSRIAGLQIPVALPLVVVLAVQAVLSVRLLRADTAFLDEAAYLWAGHLQWAHWLHGASIPPLSSYFSGAPVIYPPLGAVADSVGGLSAARGLSLVFMLGATALLWDTSRLLFGGLAAFFAAAIFSISGPALHLGAFATYDALSVLLVALAVWLIVRGARRQNATRWLVAAGAVLAVANAAAYYTVLFDVVVIAIAFLVVWPEAGAKAAAARCLTVLLVVLVLLTAGALVGGSSYLHGFAVTTLDRAQGGAAAGTVLTSAWIWIGVAFVAAACGVGISMLRRGGGAQILLLAVLAASALLSPLDQARLQTAVSLNKHVVLGLWFAVIAAGYAVDQVIVSANAGAARTVTCAACVVALAFPFTLGISQAEKFSTAWPNSQDVVAVLRPLVGRGHLLIEDPSVAEYYLHAESQWQRWSSTRNIVLPSGASSGGPSSTAGVIGAGNAGTFGTKIEENYFSLVALNFSDTTTLDLKIKADLAANPHYKKILVVDYGPAPGTYVIWRYEPGG